MPAVLSPSSDEMLSTHPFLFLSLTDLARLLDEHPITVRGWDMQQKIPLAGKTADGRSLFDWPTLRKVLREAISQGIAVSLSQAKKKRSKK